MPGIGTGAPERTDTSKGRFGSPKKRPVRAPRPFELAFEDLFESVESGEAAVEISAAKTGAEHEPRRDGEAAAPHAHQIVRLRAHHIFGRQVVGPVVGDPVHVECVVGDGSSAHPMTSSMR
jgi:hypothetical protein